jgi:hypothetical protein
LPSQSAPNLNSKLLAFPKALPSYPPDRKGQERGMSFPKKGKSLPKKGKSFPKRGGDANSNFNLDIVILQ